MIGPRLAVRGSPPNESGPCLKNGIGYASKASTGPNHMMRTLFWAVSIAGVACSPARAQSTPEFAELGPFLDSLSAEYAVPGLAFAVFDDTGTLFEHLHGVKNATTDEPLDQNTVFEAASISKPVFAYIVLSLVKEGVLNLDTPLGSLVPELPDVAYDPRAALLTARLLLTHQGGLPNWRGRLNLGAQTRADLWTSGDTLKFTSDPGEKYSYSGEGFVLLQRVVEELTGKSLGALASERVFGPLGMANSAFVFDHDRELNYSHGHNREGAPDKWQLRVPLASSTLLTTAADLARFGSHLSAEIQGDGPYQLLATPAVTVETHGDQVHRWGLGLGLVTDGGNRYIYHGGNNVIFIADFIYGVDENLGYVLLTNSANGPRVIEALEQRMYGRALNR